MSADKTAKVVDNVVSAEAESPPRRGLEFGSMPALTQSSFRAVRVWRKVPEDINDETALIQGIISPELIQLIMTIVMDLFQNCLDNSQTLAWRRVKNFVDNPREMDKMGDTIRLNWMVDRWISRLGIARDRGDVVAIRKAIIETAGGLKQEEFVTLQTEVLFLTV